MDDLSNLLDYLSDGKDYKRRCSTVLLRGHGLTTNLTRFLFRREGLKTLYNGLIPSLLRTFPATAALFLAYENTKKILSNLK